MSRRKAHLPPFVAIGRHTLTVPEWRTGLSSSEKIIYLHLKSKFVGHNNGEIVLHYSELLDMFSSATISKALKGLEKKGWMEKTKQGGLYRYTNKYRLTFKYDNAYAKFN